MQLGGVSMAICLLGAGCHSAWSVGRPYWLLNILTINIGQRLDSPGPMWFEQSSHLKYTLTA